MAIGLVTIARDIVGIWGIRVQVVTTTGREALKEWPKHPRNIKNRVLAGTGWRSGRVLSLVNDVDCETRWTEGV